MSGWRRPARLAIAVLAVALGAVVATQFRPRTSVMPAAIPKVDPAAIVESTKGRSSRVNLEHEDVRLEYDTLLGYEDGSTKMLNLSVVTERAGGRMFTVTAREGRTARNEGDLTMSGEVRMSVSDGLVVRTEQAAYTEVDGMLRAAGAVSFSRGGMSGSGLGMTYAKNTDVMTILDQAVVHLTPDEGGTDPLVLTAGTAEFVRPVGIVNLRRGMRLTSDSEVTEADAAVARLSADEQQLEALDLRGRSGISGVGGGPGTLTSLTGQDIDVTYRAGGRSIERARTSGGSAIDIAGESGGPGRQITARAIDLTLGPDGSTPTAIVAREGVKLSMPADANVAARTISADAMDGRGNDQGLTGAKFSGNVQFAELGADSSRTVRSAILDVDMGRGLSTIDEARFSSVVQVADGTMTATAAAARYVLAKGALELTGSEPKALAPHLSNDRIDVIASRIDVVLEGPVVTATGKVRSTLRPSPTPAGPSGAEKTDRNTASMLKSGEEIHVTANALTYDGQASRAVYSGTVSLWQGASRITGASIVIDDKTGNLIADGGVTTTTTGARGAEPTDRKTPSMLKADQEVQVTAHTLTYDEQASRAVYSGNASLWQGEIRIKGASIVIDYKTGDLTAHGGVTTTAMVLQEGKAQTKERLRSNGAAKEFKYEESLRRATYTGDASLVDTRGDLRAAIIELYLKPSGDEIDRVEARQRVALTMVEKNRRATGDELKYFSAEERYEVTGTPVTIIDECARRSEGLKLTFFRSTDRITLNGNPHTLTQTRSDGSACR